MPVTHWLYPTNERSDYVLTDSRQKTSAVSPATILADVERAPEQVDRWLLSSGYRAMRPGDAVWIYASRPYQYICAIAQVVEAGVADAGAYVLLAWNLDATRRLMAAPILRPADFQQVPQQAAVRADPVTVAALDGWLLDEHVRLADLDGDPDPGSETDTRLRRLRSIVQRQGQHGFRQQLLRAYGSRCAMTGEGAVPVLEAAHIRPYRGEHTNKVSNGLLLRADLHLLFDKQLISVAPDSTIVVSAQLKDTSYAELHGVPLRVPRLRADRPDPVGLAGHRAELCP
jgi:HNH endonuclease